MWGPLLPSCASAQDGTSVAMTAAYWPVRLAAEASAAGKLLTPTMVHARTPQVRVVPIFAVVPPTTAPDDASIAATCADGIVRLAAEASAAGKLLTKIVLLQCLDAAGPGGAHLCRRAAHHGPGQRQRCCDLRRRDCASGS
jgi:hypothetical protein